MSSTEPVLRIDPGLAFLGFCAIVGLVAIAFIFSWCSVQFENGSGTTSGVCTIPNAAPHAGPGDPSEVHLQPGQHYSFNGVDTSCPTPVSLLHN